MAFIGGFIELYSIKVRGTYAGMMTGNVINTFISFLDNKTKTGLFYLSCVLTFFFTCFIVEGILLLLKKNKKNFRSLIIFLQIIVLMPSLFLKVTVQEEFLGYTNLEKATYLDLLINCFLSIYGALQFTAFNKMNGHVYVATMLSSTLKNFVVNLMDGIVKKDKNLLLNALDFFLVATFFIFGGIVFYLSFKNLNTQQIQYLLIIPISILFILFIFSFITFRNEETNDDTLKKAQ